MAINAKLGSASANSYVTLTEANNYFSDTYLSTTWDNLTATQKEIVLKQACRDIDMFNFIGEQYYENQKLQFPRDDHDVLTGNCATPITNKSFKNTSFTVTTYGEPKSLTNYWKYGAVHITSATPLHDVRLIASSNISTDVITVASAFSATPTTNTQFIAFEPLHKEIKDAQCEQAQFLVENSKAHKLAFYRGISKSVTIGDTSVTFKTSGKAETSVTPKARRLLSRWIERNITVLRG